MNANVQLDAGEAGCSELIMLIFQTMKPMAPGEILEVSAYDQIADIDIMAWCRMTGNVLVAQNRENRPQRFYIRKVDGQTPN
jgi:TusA-related sulfurtransferase